MAEKKLIRNLREVHFKHSSDGCWKIFFESFDTDTIQYQLMSFVTKQSKSSFFVRENEVKVHI